MFMLMNLFLILLFTIVQSQNVPVYFPTFSVNTDIGSCTCDLTGGICDVSCCCDPDCSSDDLVAFGCSSRANIFTNSSPVLSTIQGSCFKDLSIFQSTSPYIIQKMGELVCIDYYRYTGSQYYQQPNIQTLDANAFVQAINKANGVTTPADPSTDTSSYQVGTKVLATKNNANVASFLTLPVNLFNNPMCSGNQPITYMNNFTSTCSQVVNQATCTTGALNPSTYINQLCLFSSPSKPHNTSGDVCVNGSTVSTPTFDSVSNSCSNALQQLTITITYNSSIGIVGVSVIPTTATANSTPFEQTFTVIFIKSGSTLPSTTRGPGYLQSADIIAGISNGSDIGSTNSPQFSIIKPSSTGVCSTTDRIPIRFGENVQSTCQYTVSSTSCSNSFQLLMPYNSASLYVAAYSNSNPFNVSIDWLPVTSCTYTTQGDANTANCITGILLNTTSATSCYSRLDIQIAYTNIGSVFNPQPVLSAVIFHYQGYQGALSLGTVALLTETVTFQDISASPITIQGHIPTPSTRLPADFFYPFSVSHATKFKTFSPFFYIFISILFIFV
ncbi:unnamed protein product [Adineta steineri]|uniref:Tectonic-like protein n=1 Tax=Adineta steineri TaxID=433720 RepID=A0A814I2F6_9BILA|nr:unnamed protein product [Adineta steineri]